ncbi:phosphatidate cytidylyltransferase [Streptococcus acidominimus]|uniref:Phosphatidate cytidylyltransferase n=1 Tax=Streptococcus acidominimus TaxID=1326 RepID=A0A1Q8EBY8_STRAI|nr:phosphatidate cytidylyltransferase [Streptococcus acidominimus]MBF0847957.1 phosphatidate cytidylyltransferase [Streptococcus danieliae]MBF0819199.1 phosphatidate cytidylyltransferase [Streptococcus acidominimus]MBF0837822.1 phosphatidate cytidylyltransferase [Streptococcus acidominimus]OLF49313.1 phosphatidate cytidylyltransferase [Streptococcus acidominimus]TFU30205.1 phosphatidate cytidylyltransferase [Streptococcus acidominimus]
MSKDLQKRVIFGGVALAIFIPFLLKGGVPFQLFIGLLAMMATAELMKMHGLLPNSIEGMLTMLGSLVLTLPLENYLTFLPTDGNYTAYALVVFCLLGSTVFNIQHYSYSEVAFPIASSFYVGIGFHHLILARMDGLDKVLFALFIVWATDIGAYMIGSRIGRRRLMPKVSPNKTLEGSLGGIVSALVVALIFILLDKGVASGYSLVSMLLLVVLFSIFAQFGDLVESAIKRRFGVKDSGRVIPGHGGILDRFDSLIFVFPIMHFFGLF